MSKKNLTDLPSAEKLQPDIPAKQAKSEPVYTKDEFEKAALKIFGVQSEIVTAAFKTAGKTEATIPEAKRIVESFMKKEVR